VITADRKMKAAKAAFDASVDRDITFFDTAEVYGSRVRKGSCYHSIILHEMQ
jgi:aryl-alcohol dehydrogenase-like predicted oxidoreductase